MNEHCIDQHGHTIKEGDLVWLRGIPYPVRVYKHRGQLCINPYKTRDKIKDIAPQDLVIAVTQPIPPDGR